MTTVDTQVTMEYDDDDYHTTQSQSPEFPVPGCESPGGCRTVPPGKKKHFRVRGLWKVHIHQVPRSPGTWWIVTPRVRALNVLGAPRNTVLCRGFHQEVHGTPVTDS
jgi:hypothetical protein